MGPDWAIKTGLVAIPIPPQDLGDILDSTGTQVRPGIIFPGPLKTYDPWWKYCFDKKTEETINKTIHPVASVGEQIGILRDQIVQILNALGIEPTPEFARLNEIAIREIEAAREKKEEISAQDNSS